MMHKIREKIIQHGCMMLDSGLIVGTWGNISARIPETNCIAITPSGRNYRNLQTEDIPILDLLGNSIEGACKPSSENALHLAIYNQRPDVQAIIHTHSTYATACAVAHVAIPPIVEDLIQLVGGGVDIADYAICGSNELANNAVAALGEKNAVLLANHGVVGCGISLHEAKIACELVEKTAKIFILANQLSGEVNVLDDKDIKTMHDFYLKQYRQK